jgi:uncharacterized protein YukJ
VTLRSYGVLAGRVVGTRAEGGSDSPHFQVHVHAAGVDYRVAVNVLSSLPPSELLYVADESFAHPLLVDLPALPDGFTPVPSTRGGLALDFVRGNLLDRTLMRPVPASSPGPDNDLADRIGHYTERAMADPDARVFAFGERWGPEPGKRDKVFGFAPGNGVHDVHMNQGNSGPFVRDDGVWQDGGLLLHFPREEQWVAVFLAFQSQSWHTDDSTGHALPGQPGPAPGPSDPHGVVRVVAALVNGRGPAPEVETVTLLNTAAAAVALDGWALVDRNGNRMPLPGGRLETGGTLRVTVAAPVQLGNGGGTITLLDDRGLKVDGVAYTRDQVSEDGVTVVF